MAREIKFRFRDEPTKKEVFECRNGEIYITATGCPISIHNHGHADYEDFIVEQYTGLTDKNGKEIYEGDVVKCYDHKNKTSFTGTVSFQSASFFIETSSCSHFRWMDYEVEVIGNIHENPELI